MSTTGVWASLDFVEDICLVVLFVSHQFFTQTRCINHKYYTFYFCPFHKYVFSIINVAYSTGPLVRNVSARKSGSNY